MIQVYFEASGNLGSAPRFSLMCLTNDHPRRLKACWWHSRYEHPRFFFLQFFDFNHYIYLCFAPMYILALSDELLIQIVSYHLDVGFTLSHGILVCKRLYTIALPLLYRNLEGPHGCHWTQKLCLN